MEAIDWFGIALCFLMFVAIWLDDYVDEIKKVLKMNKVIKCIRNGCFEISCSDSVYCCYHKQENDSKCSLCRVRRGLHSGITLHCPLKTKPGHVTKFSKNKVFTHK